VVYRYKAVAGVWFSGGLCGLSPYPSPVKSQRPVNPLRGHTWVVSVSGIFPFVGIRLPHSREVLRMYYLGALRISDFLAGKVHQAPVPGSNTQG
jgi:hypothetical protein